MKPHKVIPFDKNNYRYPYRCPYYNKWGNKDIPDERTATALFIYFHIYFREKDSYSFHSHLRWLRRYKIIVTGSYSLLIHYLCTQDYKYLYCKPPRNQFYEELRYLVSSSPLWEWVIPHLRKTYPNFNFMEVKNETT